MGDSNQQGGETMEQLLKKVYAVHKDSLKGVNANITKYKSAYLKILEKCKQLQRINDELSLENRKLSTAITTRQSRDGSCCEVIRQSLETVITSYKQMLADKDARINQLENELCRFKGVSGNNSLEQLCVKNNISLSNTSQVKGKEQDQDSMSCITPNITKQKKDYGMGAAQTEEELVFDISPDDAKLKLNRKRSKRSRYSEEVSPDHKKQRHSSPLAEFGKTSDKVAENSQNKVDKTIGMKKEIKTANEVVKARKVKKKDADDKILVADTCVPDLNESVVTKGFDIGNSNVGDGVDDFFRKHFDTNVVVVPETVAVDMDDTVMPEDTCIADIENDGKKFEQELPDVEENLKESDTLKADDDRVNMENDARLVKLTPQNKAEKKQKGKDNKHLDIPQSFRGILESSESDSSEVKEEASHNLDIDCGESLVKDSDDNNDDTFFDSLPNSQKFLKFKSKGDGDSLIEADKSIRNVCRSMKEVDALFETPESKHSEKGNKDYCKRKPLFIKGKKECLKEEDKSEVILRRSPRKHKPVISTQSPKTPSKVQTKLIDIKPSPNSKSQKGNKKEKKSTEHCEELDDEDMDITVAPERNVDNITEEEISDLNENETIDCYNVMPIKDGNVIPSGKFQVKVKGVKKLNNSLSDNDVKGNESCTAHIVNMHDQTLKSPSILCQSTKTCPVEETDSITVGITSSKTSNLSDSNGSSVDSPLIFKTDRYKEQIDDDLEIMDWKSAKSKRKKNSSESQNSLSLSTKRASLRSSKQGSEYKRPIKDSLRKSKSNSYKVQTTLTQGFFSPKKVDVKNSHIQDGLKSKAKKNVNNTEVGNTEQRVLREIKENDNGAGNAGNNRLNGSLDPSAELSEWCRDQETLSSLDTDFCEADLQNDASSQPKTSTLAVEDTQDIPCSSTSYKFLPKKNRRKDIENIDPEKNAAQINDSFDRLPRSKTSDIAHVAVVRKRDERLKLQGHGCKQCVEYYKSAGRSEEEIQQHMHKCSRHRAQYVPPDTPPHFWSVGFIETQENDNTDVKENNLGIEEDLDAPTYRRRRRLNKYFRSKNENSVVVEEEKSK